MTQKVPSQWQQDEAEEWWSKLTGNLVSEDQSIRAPIVRRLRNLIAQGDWKVAQDNDQFILGPRR